MVDGSFVAADLGASSGRVILARVGAGRLDLREVRRFRNGPVRLPDGLYWDVLGLYQDVLTGLRDTVAVEPAILGVAVDSWAVDYGLLDPDGVLLGNPHHYREDRTAAGVTDVHSVVSPERLYEVNGLQHLPFNTVFQLAADSSRLAGARRLLLVPDLIGYWLSGCEVAEETNASTTGLLDASTGNWSEQLIGQLGLAPNLLAPIVRAGERIGPISATVRAETGLAAGVELTAVGSHDTASAVVGVPAAGPGFAYISCGTWGLVGVELAAPVLTAASRAANFTNERGIDGSIRYLRNVMGLWLLQESLRHWTLAGAAPDLTGLLTAAAALPPGGPVIDVDAPQFLPPGDMPSRIAAACVGIGARVPQNPVEFVRCILDSLAAAFAAAVRDAERLSGQSITVVHLVGGGSQNALLCQLTADACGLPVIGGPVEATAIGNVLVQARTHGVLSGDIWALRDLVRQTHPGRTYPPQLRQP
ncbi:rhamnulokinase family protein [soil metagenome]